MVEVGVRNEVGLDVSLQHNIGIHREHLLFHGFIKTRTQATYVEAYVGRAARRRHQVGRKVALVEPAAHAQRHHASKTG